jgi:hypothetical protein
MDLYSKILSYAQEKETTSDLLLIRWSPYDQSMVILTIILARIWYCRMRLVCDGWKVAGEYIGNSVENTRIPASRSFCADKGIQWILIHSGPNTPSYLTHPANMTPPTKISIAQPSFLLHLVFQLSSSEHAIRPSPYAFHVE